MKRPALAAFSDAEDYEELHQRGPSVYWVAHQKKFARTLTFLCARRGADGDRGAAARRTARDVPAQRRGCE